MLFVIFASFSVGRSRLLILCLHTGFALREPPCVVIASRFLPCVVVASCLLLMCNVYEICFVSFSFDVCYLCKRLSFVTFF